MDLDNEIYAKFSQIGRLFQKQFIKNFKHNRSSIDPSRGQGRILRALHIKDGISTKDLAYILGIQVCSLNELLQKLEKSDYIYRKPSEKDKRVSLIYLTEKGKEADFEFPESDEILEGFDEKEKEQLNDYLSRIIENMQDEETEEGFGPFGGGFGPFNPLGKKFGKFFFDRFGEFPDFF